MYKQTSKNGEITKQRDMVLISKYKKRLPKNKVKKIVEIYMIKQTYCYLLKRFESLIWSVESSVFLYKLIFKSILPLIPRITTNKFLLILLYKGHAIKK